MQEKTLDGMRVRREGRGVYLCSSESEPGREYFVDIMANDGLGQCDCPDFRTRRFARYQRLGVPLDSFRCKHLRRVRCHVLDQIITFELQKEKQAKKELTKAARVRYSQDINE